MRESELENRVVALLGISKERAATLIADVERLYKTRMRERFSELRVAERLKRTNPFLLRIRGVSTLREWATLQVDSALFASEEEAVGHVLESVAKLCHPEAKAPQFPDDFDFEMQAGETVEAFQVKMSWDCMPMSSRKNLSNTIRRVRDEYKKQGKEFVGYFAPCYGRRATSKPPGQEYVSLASRSFWTRVGGGDEEYDVKVGDVCGLLCSEFRREIKEELVPALGEKLIEAAGPLIGGKTGQIDYAKLFRFINP